MYSSVFDGRLSLVTAPASEPVLVSEAKTHLRVDGSSEDNLLEILITSARQHAESHLRRALITQTYDLTLDRFPRHGTPIEIPRPPLQSVTSVQYVDLAGTTQTWASSEYAVDAPAGDDADFGRIVPDYLQHYPDTQRVPNAATIRFVAGYGDAADVPAGIKQAILLILGHLYANRESVAVGQWAMAMPQGAEALLAPYRALRF